MILPRLLAALTDNAIPIPPPDLSPAVADIAAKASEHLLAGEELPPDYRLHLLELPPDERMLAIIYLRRLGLLRGAPFPLDDILRPTPSPDETTP